MRFPGLAFLALLIGCGSMPWSDEKQPKVEMEVPPEDREKVEELLQKREQERQQIANAMQRREVALGELARARDARMQWQAKSDGQQKEEAIRAWNARIMELENEVRQLNVILGKNPDEGLTPPTPPLPPSSPATPVQPPPG